MQKQYRSVVVAILALLALSITLAACGGSDKSKTTIPASQTARHTMQYRIVEVFPAISAKHGVMALKEDRQSHWTNKYTCERGFKTIKIDALTSGAVDYNGTIIRNYKHENSSGYSQVVLQFSGNVTRFASRAVSIIAKHYDYNNDAIANLRPSMVNAAGIKLNSRYFEPIYNTITTIQFCIKP